MKKEDPGANCPKCHGTGVDRKGRVCGYHAPNPERIAAHCAMLRSEILAMREQQEQEAAQVKTSDQKSPTTWNQLKDLVMFAVWTFRREAFDVSDVVAFLGGLTTRQFPRGTILAALKELVFEGRMVHVTHKNQYGLPDYRTCYQEHAPPQEH